MDGFLRLDEELAFRSRKLKAVHHLLWKEVPQLDTVNMGADKLHSVTKQKYRNKRGVSQDLPICCPYDDTK